MKFVSQKGNYTKIGNTNYTLDRYGCLICSWAMVTGTTPEFIAKQPVFNSDAVLISPGKLASIIGTEYNLERSRALYDPVICEVRIGSAQHFVVRYQGKIYDPYTKDGKPYRNYTILSYRNVKPKGGEMIQQNDLDGRVFTYKGMVLLWVKPEWIGKDQNDKSKPLPNTWAVSVKDLPVDCSNETRPLQDTISELGHDLKVMKNLLEDESAISSKCALDKDNLQKKIDEHKCEVKELTAWEHFRLFINKLLERK